MVAVLKKGENKKNVQKLMDELSKRKNPKGIDAHKFYGVIHLKENALEIQKK